MLVLDSKQRASCESLKTHKFVQGNVGQGKKSKSNSNASAMDPITAAAHKKLIGLPDLPGGITFKTSDYKEIKCIGQVQSLSF
jgi:hypothetical protein